jgi:plasmid maintenance system antidote protein VapI
MTKNEAIRLFGTTSTDLARAMGLSRSRISQWDDTLTQEQTDRVIGAAVRLGKLPATPCCDRERGAA